jgi:transcriptional regulator with XRE-family HTH domain
MTKIRQVTPTTESPQFATLLVMALAPEEVGARIRQRREALGWTHQRLADEMDVALRTAQRWQEGDLPRLGTLMALADVMSVERSYFVEEEDRLARVEALAEEALTRLRGIEELLRAASTRARRGGG